MIKEYIKKNTFVALLLLTSMLGISNTADASTKAKKAQNTKLDQIDTTSWKAVVFEKGEFDSTISQMDQKKGVSFIAKDGTCDFNLFFKHPIVRNNAGFGKNKISLPKSVISSAEIITTVNDLEVIDDFAASNLYEFDTSRNYVLVSDDCHHRIDIWTDTEGYVTQLGIVFFENADGVVNYFNAIKILKNEYDIKS